MRIRITGLDTPVGGVSWEYTENAKKGIQELYYFLEAKRILTNPAEMEIENWCAKSAIEIRNKLTELLPKYDFNGETITCFRTMIDSCNSFLDDMGCVTRPGIIYKNGNGDWEDINFSKAMKKFRKSFRDNIRILSEAYQIEFKNDIPEKF
ncbi:hypothetical protein CAFE_28040 [Caprobacter fermentans]|uniref:Uncharacterized protein n=1 Tax=Caproicibacter fermentans TaxID=2576756 RepID=A0A6N8I3I8_9FIRM|nr:DUF6650 family protein [Caproicibacter fermentans]MVB12073.1 hypothetical protein [Caproicibacter fermentans]OCN00217.1 hypothetical protein A7X67_18115 [Clostridium sp. W14A]